MQERKEASYVDMEFKVNNLQKSIPRLFRLNLFALDVQLLVLAFAAGAFCHPGDRLADRLHDVGDHRSGQRSRHRLGQGGEEE